MNKNKGGIKMRKYITMVLSIVGFLILTGCEKVENGIYKEGNYFGSSGIHTASVTVDKNGQLISVFIDAAYIEYENGQCKEMEEEYGTEKCIPTTKKTLREKYGMKQTSANIGKIPGGAEWYEQVETLEKKIIEDQGLSKISVREDGKTDSVSGVTIEVDEMYQAVFKALEQAK